MATNIIYFISPPPNIIVGFNNINAIKNNNTKIDIPKEYIFNCCSKYPKNINNKKHVDKIIFGTINLLQS